MLRRFAPELRPGLHPELHFLAHLLLVALLVGFAPCAQARTRPHYVGTLRVEVEGDPLQLDPAQGRAGMAWRLILDGLTNFDARGNVQPALAVRWTSDSNDRRWQFWLRPGVNFHNNTPLTAQAVIASLDQSCSVSHCAWTAVRAVGASVVFTSDAPMPSLPALLATDAFLIRQTSAQDGEEGSQAASQIVGTGPFCMAPAKSAQGGKLRLEANDDSWQGRPFLDAIEIESRKATREEWLGQNSALNSDKADLIEVLPSDIRQARQQRLNLIVSPERMLLALQVNHVGLAPQLRAAIALAVDRTALFQVIFQKQGEVTASMLPNALSGYSFLFSTERDVPRAVALRAGVTPPGLTLASDGSAPMQLAAERLALNLRDAGFAVKVVAGANSHADLVLRTLALSGATSAEALNLIFHGLGESAIVPKDDPNAAYRAEHGFLEQHTLIPLLYLPRAWASGERVRDLRLDANGMPDLADVNLNASPKDAP